MWIYVGNDVDTYSKNCKENEIFKNVRAKDKLLSLHNDFHNLSIQSVNFYIIKCNTGFQI